MTMAKGKRFVQTMTFILPKLIFHWRVPWSLGGTWTRTEVTTWWRSTVDVPLSLAASGSQTSGRRFNLFDHLNFFQPGGWGAMLRCYDDLVQGDQTINLDKMYHLFLKVFESWDQRISRKPKISKRRFLLRTFIVVNVSRILELPKETFLTQ